MLTYHCIQSSTMTKPRYLGPFISTADVPGRRALRSARTNRLIVPPVKLSTVGSVLFRLPPLKSGTQYRNTSSQLSCCSPSGVTWKRFYYNNLFAYSTLVDFGYLGHFKKKSLIDRLDWLSMFGHLVFSVASPTSWFTKFQQLENS